MLRLRAIVRSDVSASEVPEGAPTRIVPVPTAPTSAPRPLVVFAEDLLQRPKAHCSVKDCRGLDKEVDGFRWLGAPFTKARLSVPRRAVLHLRSVSPRAAVLCLPGAC